MRVSTVDEVLAMEDDEVIQAFSGTLSTLWKPKTGESEKGKWSFQNGEITAGGKKIKVCFKNRDEVPQSMKGKKITILAYHGDRGWSGSYASSSEYKGKTTREIKVTATAEVTEGGTASSEPATETTAPKPHTGGGGHLPPHDTSAPGTRAGTNATLAISDAKVFISRRVSGIKICLKGASVLRGEYEQVEGNPMTEDQYQAIVSTLFIAGDKAGIFDGLPVNIEYATLQPKAAPAPAPAPKPEPKPEPKAPEPGDDPDQCPL
jgi:hypothetical protein